MDECDVCGKPADLTCSKCFQAVYCSVGCQTADHPEHSECECFHPTEMTPEQLQFEIGLEMEFPLMDDQPTIDSNIMDNHEDALTFLIGLRNRVRTKRKIRGNKRKLRKERRMRRAANKGKRTAKRGIRQERTLNKTTTSRKFAQRGEEAAQRQFGTRRF